MALLRAVRNGEETRSLERDLATFDRDRLAADLADDRATNSFWVNLYNAFIQMPLEVTPDLFDDRATLFGGERIAVAGRYLSLDAIEHGMLRRSQLKYGIGYVSNPLASDFERSLRVDRCDPRIHFALNCGAASCPPIAVYTPADIDAQLDLASEAYLETEVDYDVRSGTVHVPRLCLWYHGDFKGHRGIRAILRRYDRLPEAVSPTIRFNDYDWSLDRANYSDTFATETHGKPSAGD
jgi:hypothetical protein